MTTDLFARWNLTPVINASGTMTGIGASRVPAEIRAVVDEVLGQFVGMDELQSLASDVIAGATGAEAGCVTGCAAAAITQTVAACLTGVDLAKIEALPRVWTERRVLLPMGHMINYGAPGTRPSAWPELMSFQSGPLRPASSGTFGRLCNKVRLPRYTSSRTTPCAITNCRLTSSSKSVASMA